MTTSRRLAPLPLLLIGLAALAVLVLIPWVVHAQTNNDATGRPVVLVSELWSRAALDLFSRDPMRLGRPCQSRVLLQSPTRRYSSEGSKMPSLPVHESGLRPNCRSPCLSMVN